MRNLKNYLVRATDALVAISFLLVALILIDISLALATRYVQNDYLTFAFNLLNTLSLLLSAGAILSYVYQKRQRNREIARLRDEFESAINARGIKVKDVVTKYVPDFVGFTQAELTKVINRFWNEFQTKARIDSDLDFDLIKEFVGMAAEKLSLEKGQRLFLLHQYFAQHEMDLLQRFKDSLNKSNYPKEGTAENLYSRLLTLQAGLPSASFSELMTEKDKVTEEDIERVASEAEGHESMVKKIEKIISDQKSQAKLTSLQRIVKRLVLDTYISETGLLSLMENKDDLIFIMKSEAGVGGLKTVFQKAKEITPFKKALLAHGFEQVGHASPGAFVISAGNLPPEYRSQVPLFMQKVIIPEVEQDWTRLRGAYKFKRLQHMTYSYIAFRVKLPEIKFGEVNTKIKPKVVDILSPVDMKGTAEALASHVYEIPTILKKMEIDAIIDSGTENMKLALRNSEQRIREGLKKDGIKVENIADYRKVDPNVLARLIENEANPELVRLSPKAKRKFDDKSAPRISKEIVANSTDLFNLVTGIGVSI